MESIIGSLLDMPLSSLQLLSEADVVLYDSLPLSKEDIQRLVKSQCMGDNWWLMDFSRISTHTSRIEILSA
jgi:hypothetical protein